MEVFFVSITILGIAYAIYKLFELYARRKERIFMLEKMSFSDGGINPPVTKSITSRLDVTSILSGSIGLNLKSAISFFFLSELFKTFVLVLYFYNI